MPRYIILSRLSPEGHRLLSEDRTRIASIRTYVESVGGRIVEQHALLGDYEFCTVVDAPDNAVAQMLGVVHPHSDTIHRVVMPAIDLDLFVKLLSRSTELTGPYPWQIGLPARVFRRSVRWFMYGRYIHAFAKPLTVEGRERLDGLEGPAIFIGNHTSHFDSLVLPEALPSRYKHRVASPSAADRFFVAGRKGITKQGWWHSLTMNMYPLQRGGGRNALDYTRWLIDHGWSIVIFPEGSRSRSGKLGKFKVGPALLAVEKGVPVVPIYMEGLHKIRPSGSRDVMPGPVHVRVGRPQRFAPGTDVGAATRELQTAMQELGNGAARESEPGTGPSRHTPAENP